jgi:hypothetical protein
MSTNVWHPSSAETIRAISGMREDPPTSSTALRSVGWT